MKKKIYFILPGVTFGGAERVITIIMNSINPDKYQPVLVLFNQEGFPMNLLNSNVEFIEFNISRIRFAPFKLIKILIKDKPDIVFGGWGEVSAFIAPLIPFFPKTRFITRETNIVSQHVTRPVIKFFYKFYNNYKTIIAQSDDMKQDLVDNLKIKASKIIKINNPVDIDFIQSKAQEKLNLPYSSTSKNVVAIGNLSYRKGFDNLLRVFSNLKEENINLYILGDGDDKEDFLKIKEELNLDKVHFVGKVTNPYPYLKNADLFILSSRYEGFPNVLLEAGACGTFSLANNCKGGINEIIQSGINGEIFSIENSENFAVEIKKALDKKYDKETIQNSIKNRFSKETIIKKYEEIFN